MSPNIGIEIELDPSTHSAISNTSQSKTKVQSIQCDRNYGSHSDIILPQRESSSRDEEEAGLGGENAIREFQLTSKVPDVVRMPYPISKAAWIVIMVGSLERMAFYGGSTPFQNYIQNTGGPGQSRPGQLGKGQVAATALNQYL